MSTEIKVIKGRYEDINKNKTGFKVEYKSNELYLTRFAGGKKNGTMLQLSISENGYTQLNKEQVKELIQALEDAFDYDKYPRGMKGFFKKLFMGIYSLFSFKSYTDMSRRMEICYGILAWLSLCGIFYAFMH